MCRQSRLNFLLLLECLYERGLQAVRVLRLECLFNITRNTLLANNLGIFSNWTVLKSGISSFTLFFPFPHWGEIDFALRTTVRLLRWAGFLILSKIVHDVLEP